jgi:hypothetical protein
MDGVELPAPTVLELCLQLQSQYQFQYQFWLVFWLVVVDAVLAGSWPVR